jgi:acyl-coenzyme A synthetase/AMP-(fatty) acid ligase
MRSISRGEADLSWRGSSAEFRWETPATFNFGTDVVDRWALEADGEALVWAGAGGELERYRYSDMARLSDQFGALLRGLGVNKGDRVVVMLPRIPQWMVAMVGVLKIGAVPVPCIEMLTARDLTYRVIDADASAVVCRGRQTYKFDDLSSRQMVRIAVEAPLGWVDYDTAMAGAAAKLTHASVAAQDPALMYYTSGSTGHPKGVLHAARALHAWRYAAVHWLDLKPDDLIWCTADTGWSKAGTSILFGPWSCGAASFLYDGPFIPRERVRLLAEHRVTVYCAPGAELYRVADENLAGFDLSKLRRTVSAGEALSPAVAARWETATGVRVDEGYGQTEALMLAINTPGEPVRYGSMGRPLPGCDLAVIDPEGRRAPPNEEGDLALLTPSPQMMLGYWREPERTEACFRPGSEGIWYVTGDRAATDAEGYLWYRGRADDVINSAGYRIGPLEVENVLIEHPAVSACAVVGSPDPERGEIVKAFVVLESSYTPSAALKAELQDHVKALTAPYKYPRAIEFLGELPLTPTGKIRRRDLRDRERAGKKEVP